MIRAAGGATAFAAWRSAEMFRMGEDCTRARRLAGTHAVGGRKFPALRQVLHRSSKEMARTMITPAAARRLPVRYH